MNINIQIQFCLFGFIMPFQYYFSVYIILQNSLKTFHILGNSVCSHSFNNQVQHAQEQYAYKQQVKPNKAYISIYLFELKVIIIRVYHIYIL